MHETSAAPSLPRSGSRSRRLCGAGAVLLAVVLWTTCSETPLSAPDETLAAQAAKGGNGGGKQNRPPVAAAGGPYSGTAGSAVVFDGAGSNDPDGPTSKLTYSWTFGDGSGATGARPAHVYPAAATYTVTLVVTDRGGAASSPSMTTATITNAGPQPAVLVGAGDIATCGSSNDDATATLLDAIAGTVFVAGDNAYERGTLTEYQTCYDHSWGRHKARTMPAPGNHEYGTAGAAGYVDYFGAAAGDRDQGYYSYDLGTWHIIVLNSNIDRAAGSAQVQWLRADLAAHPVACTLAYWHHPRFSSANVHGNNTSVGPFWDALYEAGAEVVVVGHDHTYERFAPQTPQAVADPARGIRQFVVGTGGRSHYGFGTIQPNSQVRNGSTYGVIRFELQDGAYAWEFVPVAGATFTDSGTGACH